jgi:hypothetical protein
MAPGRVVVCVSAAGGWLGRLPSSPRERVLDVEQARGTLPGTADDASAFVRQPGVST